jgi:hypothetical protein
MTHTAIFFFWGCFFPSLRRCGAIAAFSVPWARAARLGKALALVADD